MPPRLAVFDCDGTLVDGQAAVCDAMDAAFAEIGLPRPDRNQVRRSVGLSLPHAVRSIAPEAAPDSQAALVEAYKQAFRASRYEGRLHEPLYDGMAELLRRLHADGWMLAVATGKSERGLYSCLETHGIRELFVSLQAADGNPSKPDPGMLNAALADAGCEAAAAVMIGDTSFDMAMAQAARVRALGVAWGYHAPEELLATGASAVARDVAELERLL